ncbi:hypothetical protein, partial [Ottowia sp.]|uniref:hypothetical protein n=1 Tax=Ottowia sp. TaxID=1898956 RepID=UPI0025FE9D24
AVGASVRGRSCAQMHPAPCERQVRLMPASSATGCDRRTGRSYATNSRLNIGHRRFAPATLAQGVLINSLIALAVLHARDGRVHRTANPAQANNTKNRRGY